MKRDFKFLKLLKVIKATKIRAPAVKLLQKAIVKASDEIRRTNNESGVTNRTPENVIIIPF